MSDNQQASRDLEQVAGILEPNDNKSGVLLDPKRGGKTTPHDPFIPRELLRRFKLRKGSLITGNAVLDKQNARPKVRYIDTVDGMTLKERKQQYRYDQLTIIQPKEKWNLEAADERMTTRVIDLFCPIGKGQRSLIVAPPARAKPPFCTMWPKASRKTTPTPTSWSCSWTSAPRK